MPELHGLHVLQQIRGGRTAQDYTLPVALVTAAHDEATVHYAAALACDGFLLKPVTQAKLVEKLASMMTRRRELPHRPSHYCQIDMGPPDRLPSAPGPIPTGLTVGQLHVGMVFTAPVRGLGREVIPEGVSLTAELLQLLQELEKVMTIEPIQIAKFPD
jgi:DNA-binding response OmpR family regulator